MQQVQNSELITETGNKKTFDQPPSSEGTVEEEVTHKGKNSGMRYGGKSEVGFSIEKNRTCF